MNLKDNEKPTKVVVIGGVALGAGAAAKARRENEQAEIVVIERGPYVSYANCGLPYFLGGVISDRADLLLHTPESLKARFNIDVRVLQEALAIDREHKQVQIRNVETGEIYLESYDKLVLATGAKPIMPPLPGMNLPGIFTIRSVPDVDAVTAWIREHRVRDAVVIGAGFIGLETVENLAAIGLRVTLVEKAAQILPPFDAEMVVPALKELRHMGATVITGDGITGFTGTERAVAVTLESGRSVPGGLFILGLGVRPDTTLAKAAGLELGATGAVRVNEFLQTSDPDIYSGGDLAEIRHLVNGQQRFIPLAGAANKQGRVIGANLFGRGLAFHGAMGTAIVRVGEVTLAMTGLTEKTVAAEGLDAYISYTNNEHHASYYPGGHSLTLKVVAERSTGKLLGGQVVGREGVDKRIDVLATAIAGKMTIEDLAELDLAYAPPFSSAKDPVIIAGMTAQNIYRHDVRAIVEIEQAQGPDVRVLDVRRYDEIEGGMLPGAVHIPLDELRDRAAELNPGATWVIYCRSGHRSYVACKMLQGMGFERVYNLSGGNLVQKLRKAAKIPSAMTV